MTKQYILPLLLLCSMQSGSGMEPNAVSSPLPLHPLPNEVRQMIPRHLLSDHPTNAITDLVHYTQVCTTFRNDMLQLTHPGALVATTEEEVRALQLTADLTEFELEFDEFLKKVPIEIRAKLLEKAKKIQFLTNVITHHLICNPDPTKLTADRKGKSTSFLPDSNAAYYDYHNDRRDDSSSPHSDSPINGSPSPIGGPLSLTHCLTNYHEQQK